MPLPHALSAAPSAPVEGALWDAPAPGASPADGTALGPTSASVFVPASAFPWAPVGSNPFTPDEGPDGLFRCRRFRRVAQRAWTYARPKTQADWEAWRATVAPQVARLNRVSNAVVFGALLAAGGCVMTGILGIGMLATAHPHMSSGMWAAALAAVSGILGCITFNGECHDWFVLSKQAALLDPADPATARARVADALRARPDVVPLWTDVLNAADSTGVPVLNGDVEAIEAIARVPPVPLLAHVGVAAPNEPVGAALSAPWR